MAAVSSSSPPRLSSTSSAMEIRDPQYETVARPPLVTGSAVNMNPQASSPLRAYPDPIPSDSQMSGNPPYFNARRSQQHSLSQEDQNLANTLSHDMNGHMSAMSPQISNGQAQNLGMGGVQSGMPQTPHQPPMGSSMAAQHSGTDPNQDLSYVVGSDRRKRSKVSRACDECRRKKVRCDCTTSDGNVIETCSNCRRLKLTCQFEKVPMKRGPSKGYIKELAERVQQVESQMGIPVGYRPSVDAGSPSDAYPEQPYSPTEPMSGGRKRTFSQFDGRNPFAQSPHPNRDRMTSLGGYSMHQGLSGGRGSIALAPDQQLTDISPTAKAPSVDLTKPFWAQETDVEHPRTKTAEESSAAVGDGWKADSLFNTYVDLIHDDFSILPRSFETVQSHVSKCPAKLASVFTAVLALACGSKLPGDESLSESDLDDYAWENARVLPLYRSPSENIVWLWVFAFMLINTDANITCLRGTQKSLCKRTVLKMANDLGKDMLSTVQQDVMDQTDDGLDPPQNTVWRTWNCISIIAQLHAIGTGTEDPINSSDSKDLSLPTDSRNLLSEATAFLAALSSILSLLSSHISASASSRPDPMTAFKTRKIIESFVDMAISTSSPTSASSSLVGEAQLFISLLLARHTFVNDPSEILSVSRKLAETLQSDPVNPQGHEPPVARPLDIHLYTLTGLTLLELIDTDDTDLVKSSQDALAKLCHALEQHAERAHARRQNALNGGQLDGASSLHWADALLRVIDAKGKSDQNQRPSQSTIEGIESVNEPPKDQQESPVAETTDVKENVQVISTQQQYLIRRLTNVAAIQNTIRTAGVTMTVVDFSLLTQRGYLNVLADLNGY